MSPHSSPARMFVRKRSSPLSKRTSPSSKAATRSPSKRKRSPTPEALDPRRLPANWYDKFSEKIARNIVDTKANRWSTTFAGHMTARNIFRPTHDIEILLEDDSLLQPCPRELTLHLLNKTAIFYIAQNGVRFEDGETPEEFCRRRPLVDSDFLESTYDSWEMHCQNGVRVDSEYVMGNVHLQLETSRRYDKWLALGGEPLVNTPEDKESQQDEVRRLIERHLHLCDLVKKDLEDMAETEGVITHEWTGEHEVPVLEVFSLLPTCRAVLVIAESSMAEKKSVLLVLTGANEQLKYEPPTFDVIPEELIVSRRHGNMIEVSLDTAVQWLNDLKESEERANQEMLLAAGVRRQHIQGGLVWDACSMVARARSNPEALDLSGTERPFDDAWAKVVQEMNSRMKAVRLK